MSSSYCFIINQSANRGALPSGIIGRIRDAFPDADFLKIGHNDSIADQAFQAARKFRHVVAVGGDGTVQQVAKGLLGTTAVLGVLPLGSGNDFAKSIKLAPGLQSNLEILRAGNTQRIDVLTCGERPILNTFGVGVDGLTNFYATHSSLQSATMRYFVSGFRALFRSPVFEYKMIVDGEEIKGRSPMIVVANGPVEGGKYMISPTSVNTDGIMEIIVVHNISRMRLLIEFLKLSVGLPFSNSVVHQLKLHHSLDLQLNNKPHAHADGEVLSRSKRFTFSLHQNALEVITGE